MENNNDKFEKDSLEDLKNQEPVKWWEHDEIGQMPKFKFIPDNENSVTQFLEKLHKEQESKIFMSGYEFPSDDCSGNRFKPKHEHEPENGC